MDIEQARSVLYTFVRDKRQAVIATAGLDGVPEAALIDIAVTPALEVVFETTNATRKFPNLVANPNVALVIGWSDQQTLQCDGVADLPPEGEERDRLKAFYLSVFPEKASHEFWPGNNYIRVRPRWVRLSNYYQPRRIEEFRFP